MRRRVLFAFSAAAMPLGAVMVVCAQWPGREWASRASGAVVVLALFAAFVAGSLYSGKVARRG